MIEAMVLNQDIGFVHVGQPAVIKVDAFPFARYGAIEGQVAMVSTDAVDIRDPSLDTDASVSAKPTPAPQSVNVQTNAQGLVYPIVIDLERGKESDVARSLPIRPGMGVTVEIRTGRRRVIEYLLSPLKEVTNEAGHER